MFFGCKLHIVISDVDQIMTTKITKGDIDDRKPVPELIKKLRGSIYTDLFKALYKKGLKPITGIKKNIKNYLINLVDKKLLRKKFCIEAIPGFLNNFL